MNDYIAKPVDERLLYSKIVGLVKKPAHIKATEVLDENKKVKCIDLAYLIHRTKSNPKLMMEMISLYLEQTPPLRPNLRWPTSNGTLRATGPLCLPRYTRNASQSART